MKTTTEARLKQIMRDRNLKQRDILEMSMPFQKDLGIKMGKSALSQYVNGKSAPDQNKLYLLGQTLNVDEAWLMGFDVPMEKNKIQEDYYDSLVDSILNKNPVFDEIVGKLGKLNNDELKLINNTIDNLLQIKEKRD